MTKILRNYQNECIQELLDNLKNTNKISVLALCPNAGKTLIFTKLAEELIKLDYKKIVIFSENMDILRSQNYASILEDISEELRDSVFMLDSYASIESAKNAKIIVTLPATIANNKLPFDIDLLVIDEAHNRVERAKPSESDTQIKRILENNNISKQIYLTGTPAIFILKNQQAVTDKVEEPYNIICKSMLDLYHESNLVNEDWFCSTRFYSVASNIDRNEIRFNDNGDVVDTFAISDKDSNKLINNALAKLIIEQNNAMLIDDINLVNYKDVVRKFAKWGKKEWAVFSGGLGKTMWACHNQKLAKFVTNTLISLGINTVLSCEEEKDDSENIALFQTDPSIRCLVVVNRGILGFNMPELENIVDISGTRNINRIYQLYSRITRIHSSIKNKTYYKIGFEKEDEITKMVMDTALSLCGDNINIYNLRNRLDLPVIRVGKKRTKSEKTNKGKKQRMTSFNSYEGLNILDVMEGIFHTGDYNSEYEITSKSTLKEVLIKYGYARSSNQKLKWRKLWKLIKAKGRLPLPNEYMTYSIKINGYTREESCNARDFMNTIVDFNSINFDNTKYENLEKLKVSLGIKEAFNLRQALLYELSNNKDLSGKVKFGYKEYQVQSLYYKFKYKDKCVNFACCLDKLGISDKREESMRLIEEYISNNGVPKEGTTILRNGYSFKLYEYYEMLQNL